MKFRCIRRHNQSEKSSISPKKGQINTGIGSKEPINVQLGGKMQIENHKKKYALSVSELFHQSRSMKNSSRGLVKRKKSEDLF